MLEGLEFVALIRPVPPRKLRKRKRDGSAVLQRIYGAQTGKLLRKIRRLNPDAKAMILGNVYGRVFTRAGLSLRERELINLTVLSLQGFGPQLYSHLRGGLRSGLSVSTLKSAITLIERKSNRRMKHARKILHSVVSQRKKL